MKLIRLSSAIIAAITAITPLSVSSPSLLTPSTVLAEGSIFDEEEFFVYVGTYKGGLPQFRYLYPTSDGSYNADKVIWEGAPTDLDYGDVLVADGDISMTQVYPAENDPANAHVYFYTLDEGVELNKAGKCSDIMVKKDLTVTSKTYDGSLHWSVRYVDGIGETYYYGLSTYCSDLLVDPLDCEIGDIYSFALYNDYMVVPLIKQTETVTETMVVEIVEVNGTTLLVKPADRPESNERLTLSMKYLDTGIKPIVGMKLEVTYTGDILETYPERFGNVTKVAMVSDENVLLPGQVRVTLVDADTNEPIIYQNDSDSELRYMLFRECDLGDGFIENPAVTGLKTNPEIIKYADLSEDREYTFHIEQSSKVKNYSILSDESSTVRNDNNSYDVVFKLKFTPTGDVNDDGEFNVADAVLLQKWLFAVPDTHLANWKAADFCNDNKLDEFDLCLMKRALIQENKIPVELCIIEAGGVAGALIEYRVYPEGEKKILSYADYTENRDAQPQIITISEEEYAEIMSQAYGSYLEVVSAPIRWSELSFSITIDYADGSQKKASSDRYPSALSKLRNLRDQYQTNQVSYVEPDERYEYGIHSICLVL